MTEAYADSIRSSGTDMALPRCPELRQEAQAFVSCFYKSHWIRAMPGEEGT